jgi:nucleotide-binding universal stress UspA family protein
VTPVDAKAEVSTIEPLGRATTGFSAVSVRNVLLATDFSPTSEAALPYAAAICRRYGGTLHAAHVLSDAGVLMMSGGSDYVSTSRLYEDALSEARQKLDQISGCIEGIPHRNYLRRGQVWKNLAGIIEENEIDLMVVGTHGRTGLGKLLLGSVAENILRRAPCPVLTVGPKVSGRAKLPTLQSHGRDLAPLELEPRHLLFATNFAKSAPRRAQESIQLADDFHARLTLIHVIEDYNHLASDPAPIEEATRKLKELIPANAQLRSAPETVIEFGRAPDRILKVATDHESDMILMGARASSEVGTTHLPWSPALQVIAQAHCPVLTIR